MKIKKRDGTYHTFRENIRSQFLPADGFHDSVFFRSNERQAIIDFVLTSRIRDSGAELGARTTLGKVSEEWRWRADSIAFPQIY